MKDQELSAIFNEETQHLKNVARCCLCRMKICFWTWLRSYTQERVEQFKITNGVGIKTTQFVVPVRYR